MKHEAMRPLTISLSPQQIGKLNRAVETGAYASNSEVVRDALRLWEQREQLREIEIARLRQAYAEGVDSGPSVDGEEAMAEMRARLFGPER
jgi:antitoxin ParD1/3/4